MEKDLYRGRREDPKAGPRAPDKTGKPITPGKMMASAAGLLNKSFKETKESDLPKAYVKGLSSSTAKARKAHWDRANKLSDRDPRAYEPAPGDANAKTVPSKATREIRKIMNKEEIEITEEAENSLSAKAKKFGVPLGTLKTVYKRGVAAWNSGHRPGTTPQQWGHARVNSYLRKGKGTYHGADKDLREAKDSREYGYEGEMVMSQLKGIMSHAEQMHNMLKPDTDLPEWVQSKVTLAYDYLQTAADYMATEMKEETTPFEGPYRKVGTYKDAHGNVVKNVPKHLAKKAMKNLKKEEVAVNAAGSGNVAGLGVGPQGEPGVNMNKKKKPVLARFSRFMKK